MPVFKVSMKILKKNIPIFLIYMLVFVMVSIIATRIEALSGGPENFSDTKINVAIFSESDSPLTKSFQNSLTEVANIVELEDSEESIQDALYFRAVYMIIRIPKDFGNISNTGEIKPIDVIVIPDAPETIQVQNHINQFLKLVSATKIGYPELSEASLAMKIDALAVKETKVSMANDAKQGIEGDLMPFFFNYMAYSYMYIVIIGVSTIMLVFGRKDLKMRNTCSPITGYQNSSQLLMANGVFALIVWVLLIIISFVMDFRNVFKMNTVYFILNSFVFGASILGLSFLIGNLVKGKQALSAIAGIVTLSACFISGVFVPQAFLGEGVLKAASFFPTYWYVKGNLIIGDLTSFTNGHLSELYSTLLIEAGFALAFIMIALVVGKRRAIERYN